MTFDSLKAVFTCLGGGRIEHSSKDQKIHIYGYSKTYGGKVDHNISLDLVRKITNYPAQNYTQSPEGY